MLQTGGGGVLIVLRRWVSILDQVCGTARGHFILKRLAIAASMPELKMA
jgi:hypothetical protein